jgi:hypothetical protein
MTFCQGEEAVVNRSSLPADKPLREGVATRSSRCASTATTGRSEGDGAAAEQTGSAFDAACVKALESVLARDASLSLGVAV